MILKNAKLILEDGIQEGSLSLGDLPVGRWRELTEEEIRLLRHLEH